MSPTISAICRFPNFEGSPGGLDGGTKSMKSNRGMPYDVCVIEAREDDGGQLMEGRSMTDFPFPTNSRSPGPAPK